MANRLRRVHRESFGDRIGEGLHRQSRGTSSTNVVSRCTSSALETARDRIRREVYLGLTNVGWWHRWMGNQSPLWGSQEGLGMIRFLGFAKPHPKLHSVAASRLHH